MSDRLDTIESKIDNLNTGLNEVKLSLGLLHKDSVVLRERLTPLSRIKTTVTRHSVLVSILGGVLTIGTPLIFMWNTHLRQEIDELKKITIIIEERISKPRTVPTNKQPVRL